MHWGWEHGRVFENIFADPNTGSGFLGFVLLKIVRRTVGGGGKGKEIERRGEWREDWGWETIEVVGDSFGTLKRTRLRSGGRCCKLFAGMLSFVNSQSSVLTETLAANVALEGLVLAVDVLVVPEVVLSSEGFTTNVTGEGSLIGVGPLVDKKVVAFGELSVAVLADMALFRPAQATRRGQEEFGEVCAVVPPTHEGGESGL